MANPFTQVYDGLWTLLETSPAFAALEPGNKIKYTGDDRSPEKRGAMFGDYLEVRIRESIGRVELHPSSSGVHYRKRYKIQIATGDQRLADMHDIEYQMLRAMADWPTVMDAIKWDENDTKIVRAFDVLETEQSLDNKELNQNIRGWTTVWNIELLLYFATETLKL
jgi:hypothetical protein